MCGFAGFLSDTVIADTRIVSAMGRAISHRGPDGEDSWCDREAGIALTHRRLSVIDLSHHGQQPMASADGRFLLVYNGEIYNHTVLRKQLDANGGAPDWVGHSDTEVLLAALQAWGTEEALKRLNGMFAFALWDRKLRRLTLARDRLGEKPLYYGKMGDSLLFGSELKALAEHPSWAPEIDRGAVSQFLRFSYVPGPRSIFKGIYKLPPGHFLEIEDGAAELAQPRAFWQLSQSVLKGELAGDDATLLNGLEAELSKAVGIRMAADVPLGAFLSGGIDSSTIVALMQAQSKRAVKTFTIGFDVEGYDEAQTAKAVAAHLGTDHTELYLTPQDALDTIPKLPLIWDEPFADSSQIPTYLLSRMTRESVTVALSGDGGDELFCGYNRYGQGHALHRNLSRLPAPLRKVVSAILMGLPVHQIDRLTAKLPAKWRYPAAGDRLQKLARVIATRDNATFYRSLVSQNQNPGDLVLSGTEPTTLIDRQEEWPDFTDFRETMMYLDAQTYLPGDILTKVDRASMAHSLETRVPFLDHDLIAHGWALPMSMKIRDGKTKWALREILGRHVPRALFERPKMGFGIPIEHWLSGPLKDWAGDLLSADRIKRQGLLNPEPIAQMWQAQLSGKARLHHQLWPILMLQAWLESGLGAKAISGETGRGR